MKKPLIIGVGGYESGSGKTTVLTNILRALTNKEDFIKCSSSTLRTMKRWGAIKYTKTEIYSSIIEDFEILNESGKDTQRLFESGAEKVLWVMATSSDLPEIMSIAIEKLYNLDGIMIEGNSAILTANPDITIFVSLEESDSEIKPTGRKVLEKAQIVLISPNSSLKNLHGVSKGSQSFLVKNSQNIQQENIINEVIDCMDKLINKKRIEELLIKHSFDNKINCEKARMIAEELGVPYHEVGKTADELKIKIKNCQLGCF